MFLVSSSRVSQGAHRQPAPSGTAAAGQSVAHPRSVHGSMGEGRKSERREGGGGASSKRTSRGGVGRLRGEREKQKVGVGFLA